MRRERHKRSKNKVALGIILITIIVVGLSYMYMYVNKTYGTYIDSGISFENNGESLSQILTGSQWKKPINSMVNLKAEYDQAKAINDTTIGWIFIPGTNINYPIMHGQNDSYYLDHNWKGEPYWNGSIFLDDNNTGFNNVSLINGHNMLNGIMFSQLIDFQNKDFFDGNHDVYIYNGQTNTQEVFKPIGLLYCEPTISLNLGNLTQEARTQEVQTLMNQSIYHKEEYNGNNVLILNTCLSNGSGKHQLLITEEIS